MGNRACLVWIALLSAIESIDIMTTVLGRAQGAVESMPISAAVINHGGMMLFVVVKVALVIAVAAAALLALRWMRRGPGGARPPCHFTRSSRRIPSPSLAIGSLPHSSPTS